MVADDKPIRVAVSPPGRLPAPRTTFVGRATELADLLPLVSDPAFRLLTLSGPGGVGKTRLAIEVARQARDRFADGVVFVDLQSVLSAELLPVAIAEFDVGGLVRKKVSDYPLAKLEELVLSVAQHHLKTIELFGAIIGFFIGVGQAIYFWFTYHG